jgi:hypothetical protein
MKPRWIPGLSLAVLSVAYASLLVFYLVPRDSIQNLDFWTWISQGEQFDVARLETWVSGLYPLGYPLLLRVAIDHGIDSLRMGQWLSGVGGLLCLIATFGIVYDTTRRESLAFFSAALLILNIQFLSNAGSEGTDMLAAGLQMTSLYLLWIFAARRPARQSFMLIGLAGIVLGLAYLVRYTGLLWLPCAVLYCIALGADRRRAGIYVALFIGAFALTASPQWAASTLVTHQPFYNWQAKNVWFGLYGQGDWVNHWGLMPDTVSLLEVVELDPAYFVGHWWAQFASAFDSAWMWSPVLHGAWIMGLLASLREWRWLPAKRMLFILALLLPIAVTAMAWLSGRFLLVTLCLQAAGIVLLGERLTDRLRLPKWFQTGVLGAGLMAAIAVGQVSALAQWLSAPVDTHPQTINDFLRSAGMSNPAEVATNDPALHATDLPARTRYAQTYAVAPSPQTLDELLNNPAAVPWHFLVLDYQSGFGDYHAIRQPALNAKLQLAPLLIHQAQVIFCLSPCGFKESVRDDIVFENGMILLGHRAYEHDDQVSLYLYWQADRTPDRSYKVSVRILAANGDILSQADNVPQLWTYATTQWKPQQTIVDFYDLRGDGVLPQDHRLALVVYDEQSLKPVLADARDGKPLGTLIPLRPK